MLEGVELGTIVSASEIGEEGRRKYMAVVCRDPSGEKGCGERRWAPYYGPARHSPSMRLCLQCKIANGRKFNFARG